MSSCYPRSHFDSIGWSFLSVFQVLTEENWNNVMDDAIRATGWGAALYFVSLVVLGNFVVLNLFLAILIGNFEGVEELIQVRTHKRAQGVQGRLCCCRLGTRRCRSDDDDGRHQHAAQ